mmetsp:Transcript_12564/g.28388  ORF Transcript_12564/g.28388 Transcript_12564/m.28388 type:complete len:579 (+) Transcript_12564:156-1892(+)
MPGQPLLPNDDTTVKLFSQQLHSAKATIGAGPYLLVVLVLGGGVYAAEGSLLLMLSIIARGLVKKWDLDPLVATVMATALLMGLLTGTISGGIACDSFGRRTPILVTYLGISVFTIVGILMPYVMLLLLAKLLLGFCLGFGVPAANAIVCESCPPNVRAIVYSLTQVLFSMGQIYSATIVWIMSPMLKVETMEWRGMLAVATLLPMLLFVLSYFWLLESPHWLLANHKVSAARDVVRQIAHYKAESTRETVEEIEELTSGMKTPYCTERVPWEPDIVDSENGDANEMTALVSQREKSMRAFLKQVSDQMLTDIWRVKLLFSPEYRLTTGIMAYVAFAANYAYYGMIYGTPDMMKATIGEGGNWSPAAGVFFAALFEIPGTFLAILLGMTLGRRMNMAIAFCTTALMLTVVVYALAEPDPDRQNLGIAGVCAVKLCITSGFIIVNLYLLECYPTKFRATGLAFCMVTGRMGAFACPFMHDGLLLLGMSNMWFFACMALLLLGASIGCMVLPYETKDEELKDDAPPTFQTSPPVGSQMLGSWAKQAAGSAGSPPTDTVLGIPPTDTLRSGLFAPPPTNTM